MIEISLLNVPCLILCSLLPLLFLPLFLPPSLTTFRTGKIECAPITRENRVFKKSNVVFSTPIHPIPMPRSIAVLENDRKLHCVAICLHEEIDASRFSGPEQFLLARRTFP